jgi:hypothetical protein
MVDSRDRDPDDDGTGPSAAERDRGGRDDLPESMRQRLEALIPEIVKKTFSAGMGAVFSTEEGIRRLAKEINIPDVAGYIGTTADTTKDKVLEVVAREVRNFLATMNVGEEITKMLTTLSFEVKTEIRFIPNSEKYTGVEPDVKGSVRVKRADKPSDKTDKEDTGERKRRFWRRDDADDGDGGDGDDGGEK